MTSTYSDNIRLTLQGNGDNNNTWGDVANTVFELIDEAVSGVHSQSCTTGTDITLTSNNGSSDQSRHMVLKLTGTPTANININVPAVEKVYLVDAQFTGSFTVSIAPSGGGTTVSFSAGEKGFVYCDGTDAVAAHNALAFKDTVDTADIEDGAITAAKLASGISNDFVPTGVTFPYWGSTAPTGYVLAYGQSLDTTTYADLFAVLGYDYGGSGSNFNVPDLRGRTVFGLDNMGGSDASRISTANTLGTSGGAETKSGSTDGHTLTVDEMPSHNHSVQQIAIASGAGNIAVDWSGGTLNNTQAIADTGGDDPHSHDITDFNVMPPFLTCNWIIKT